MLHLGLLWAPPFLLESPSAIAFNLYNGFMYVTGQLINTVSVIDPATNTVVATIPLPVGSIPFGIAFNHDNGLLYVTNQGDNTVSEIAPLTTTFSEGCNGTINNAGQTAICTVTNTYGRPLSPFFYKYFLSITENRRI